MEQTGKPRILVIDDMPQIHSLMCELSGCHSWALETASSPDDAFRLLAAKPFDAVLAGHQSLESTVQLGDQLHAIRPNLRILVCAAEPLNEADADQLRSHIYACLEPPHQAGELGFMLEEIVKESFWKEGIEVLSARPDWISLRVECRRSTAERLGRFLQELHCDLPDGVRADMAFAFREMLLNSMEHGCGFDEKKTVEVTALRTRRSQVYHLRDPGPGFSHEALQHAAVSNPSEDPLAHINTRVEQGMRPGGFGILLARQLVDELLFSERGNEVVLIKYLDP